MDEIGGLISRLRDAVEALPQGLRDHVLRVEVEAEKLARLHDVDPLRARMAALGHDLVRHKRPDELLALAQQYAVETDAVERATPILVHGPIAARILVRDYALADADILAGIDCHTTARPGMAPLEKVLFIADKVEPEKLEHNPVWREVYDLAFDASKAPGQGLDRALRRFLDLHIVASVERGWLVHQRSIDARNEILMPSF
jgi:predicted HD superfamily hydrolase involved in NAD metabolism